MPADEPAPMEPSRRERAAWYAGAILLTCILLFTGLRLDSVSIRSPLSYDGDALLIMPMVKSTIESGTHWRIERMGYPGVLELHDFPVIDHLHFAIIWLLGVVLGGDWCLVYNAYYLLTYPLTTLTGMYAFRRLGLSLPVAALGGLLYSFTPDHYMRGEAHYFLSAYWVVPLSWLPAFAICMGELPFFRTEPGGTYRLSLWRRSTLWQVLLAAATASAGAYYAFFACAIYGFAGCYQSIMLRTVKPLGSAIILSGLVTAFGVANHLPVFPYVMKNGKANVTERMAAEAEAYGMKIAQLILPADSHNLTEFGRIKSRYNSWDRPLNNENTASTMGLVATVGFFILLVKLVLPRGRDWPYGPLAAMNAFIVLYATIGGFSSLFNLLVFEQIRCPNRISIYLVFLCLFVTLRVVDRLLAGRSARVRYPLLIALAFIGIADQTPTPWFTDRALGSPHFYARRFHADRRFFTRIEETMPAGSKIFNCPYIPFPEVLNVHGMGTYEHARGYLHTHTLVWGYAMMKNREADVWNENVSHGARSQILRRLVLRGFDGIVIDKRGFLEETGANSLVNDLKLFGEVGGRVKLPTFDSEDHTLVFIDLRGYRDWYQSQDPVRFEQESKDEREFVALCWINGFDSPNTYGLRSGMRWGYGKNTISIVNPSDRVRRFKFTTDVGSDVDGALDIRIDGPSMSWVDSFVFERPADWDPKKQYSMKREYILEIPPGKHQVKVTCKPPWNFIPGESQSRMFYLLNIQFVELK
jgi:hypothetical protein